MPPRDRSPTAPCVQLRRPGFASIRKDVWRPRRVVTPSCSESVLGASHRSREITLRDEETSSRIASSTETWIGLMHRHLPLGEGGTGFGERRLVASGGRACLDGPRQAVEPPCLLVAWNDGPFTSLVTQMTLGPSRFGDEDRPVAARVFASSRATKAARPTRASIRFVVASATRSMTTPPSHSTRPGRMSTTVPSAHWFPTRWISTRDCVRLETNSHNVPIVGAESTRVPFVGSEFAPPTLTPPDSNRDANRAFVVASGWCKRRSEKDLQARRSLRREGWQDPPSSATRQRRVGNWKGDDFIQEVVKHLRPVVLGNI